MRGYQKKVIYLKNTGSSLFEGAYFIMRSDTERKEDSTSKMVDEANKIIKENFKSERKTPPFLWHALSFLVGVILSSFLYIILF